MIECIVTSSILILVVIILRILFRGKISRRLQYALWGLVLLRLLLPFSLFGSPLSVMNALPESLTVTEKNIGETPAVTGNVSAKTDYSVHSGEASGSHYIVNVNADKPWKLIWLIGTVLAGIWIIFVNFAFSRQLKKTRRAYDVCDFKLSVYVSDHIASPCLFGFLHPAVYLTSKAIENQDCTRHVLAHELCHYIHGDHIWSILRGFCLAAYWWNPLVWAAAVLSRTDGELACDEAVIRGIGEENRLNYGRTLIDMIPVKKAPSDIVYAATTMASGKHGIKERLNMIVKNPKAVIPAVAAVLLVIAVSMGCTFTGATSVPLSAEKALEQLSDSVTHTKEEVSFQIPEGYQKPQEWNIHIAGRLVSDGFSQSVHFFDDINEAKTWKPGKRYSIPISESYTELTLTAYLPDGKGGTLEKDIDLLDTPVYKVSYGLMRMQNGKAVTVLSPLSGSKIKLAEDIIFNYLIKSAAWPGVDIKTLKECYLLRATYQDGTISDYYAYIYDGKPVMQRGAEGYYSRINSDLYQKLADMAVNIPTATGAKLSPDASADYADVIDRSDLDACVSDAIISSGANTLRNGDFNTEAHTTLKTVENGSTTTVYAMALYMSFTYKDGILAELGGSHMPVAITFEKNSSLKYVLKEYWTPKDGSYYVPSIKEKFPSDIYKDAIDTQKYILARMQNCYAQAVAYGRIDTEASLARLVQTICSSPSGTSNPGAYINAHPIEYREMMYFGDYTLQYAYSEFLKGGQTDLRGSILLSAMRELLGSESIGNDIGPAQKWFDEWKANAVRLRDANSMEYMVKNYPKTAILLKMLDGKNK